MTLDRRDSEFQANRADAQWRLDAEFLRGAIGEATYVRCLTFLGYLPKEAATELALLRMSIPEDYEAKRLRESKEWLDGRR